MVEREREFAVLATIDLTVAANMFQIITEGNDKYCAHYDVAVTRSLNPQLQTFVAWIAANKDQRSVPAGTASDVHDDAATAHARLEFGHLRIPYPAQMPTS